MSQVVIPLVVIGLALCGWALMFVRHLQGMGIPVPRWAQIVLILVLLLAFGLSVLTAEAAPNPFLMIR